MEPAKNHLDLRRPVWQQISRLFLDQELDGIVYRSIARTINESGYTLEEAEQILWSELFPVLECNLRDPAGIWDGFDMEWLEGEILHNRGSSTPSAQPESTSRIRAKWAEVRRELHAKPQ